MPKMTEWLNFHGPYGQYARDGVDPKMLSIIRRWGFYFDDEWYYWEANGKVKRFPIWAYPQRVVNAERHKRPESQKKLLESYKQK